MDAMRSLVAHSIEQAGPFLRSSFEMPEHSLSAEQVVAAFAGVTTVALATVTAGGEPRVAPIGCLLVGGTFYIPTTRTAARTRMVLRRPAVSLTLYQGIDLAIIVHGRARPVYDDDALFGRVEAIQQELGSAGPRGWGKPGDGCYLAITPETVVSYTRYPDGA
jgi:hypothetical protein